MIFYNLLADRGRAVKADIPCSLGGGWRGFIPANSDAQNVPSFRRWRFEMKLSPFLLEYDSIYLVYAQQYQIYAMSWPNGQGIGLAVV